MNETPRVWNRKRTGPKKPPEGAIYVGRGTPWGNPFLRFPMREQNRDEICEAFDAYALERHTADPSWVAPLRGKHLVCSCAPRRCHADTLLRLANE